MKYHLASLCHIVFNQKVRSVILFRMWSDLQLKWKIWLLHIDYPNFMLMVSLWRVMMSKVQYVNFCFFINQIGSTDNKHNMKPWRYQIIGGSCFNLIGKYVLDTGLIRLSGISSEIWRPIDFTSYLLVLKCVSFKSLENIMARLYEE